MPNTGIAPPDFTSAVGQVRAVLGDTDAENIVMGEGEYAWYSDDDIEALLTVFGDNVLHTAAQMLRTVASSQSLLLKKWSADDLSVDGPAITRELRALARDLDNQADNVDSKSDYFTLTPLAPEDEEGDTFFEVVA